VAASVSEWNAAKPTKLPILNSLTLAATKSASSRSRSRGSGGLAAVCAKVCPGEGGPFAHAMGSPLRFAIVLCLLAAGLSGAERPVAFQTSPDLQALANRAAESTLEKFRPAQLAPDQLAFTLIDLRDPARPVRASVRGDAAIYPASVIKLFYLAAVHRWLEDGRLTDTPELRRALHDMIVDSSNDATSYIVDLLTDTTSGPELGEREIQVWFEKRDAMNRYFAELGYTGINVNKKPWGDGPYGRETQATRLFEPKRNMLTTDATARLLTEIATGRCVSPARSAEMLALLSRDPASKDLDPDNQARFSGPALPAGSKLWSKAGWTSQTRHDAIFVELPSGRNFVLVVFTTDHVRDVEIIPSVVRVVVAGLGEVAASP
jgi:beta-lactamase class A